MRNFLTVIFLVFISSVLVFRQDTWGQTRALVVTGGHGYNQETFNAMLSSLGPGITFTVSELPAAYDMFRPENRDKYDVLVFYHMFQEISDEQKKHFSGCIYEGKPVVALHHSICAYDDWEEYWRIIGGKYFHKPTILDGREYHASSYIHDLRFDVRIAGRDHPVTEGLDDFEIFDETYKGYWVDPTVTRLLITSETTSTPVIGWAKTYGAAKIVVLQSGHDSPTFENPNFRQLLKQSIQWVIK